MGAGIKSPIVADARADALPHAGYDSSSASGSTSLGKRRVRSAVIPCTASEHIALRSFLTEVFGLSYPTKFQAALEDPSYEPCDRLLLRRQGTIIAHAHITRRNMQFGALSLPVAGLDGLATDEDCRGDGLGTHLLAAAERQMARSGALIGLLRTRIPHFFRRTGWALCGSNFRGTANPHQILSQLLENGLCPRRTARIQVRPWRRWEEDAIGRVYRQNLAGSFGLLERNRNYWHWMLERRAYDHFYVALDGPDLWDLKEASTQLVGYVAIRGDKIIELMAVPGRKKVVMELLARACGDAIEHDQRQIVLHAGSDSPVQEYFDCPPDPLQPNHCEHTEVCMARLLDPLALLQTLCGVFAQRANEAGLAKPVELGLFVEGRKFQIDIAGSGRATADTLGRSYLRLNVADFTRLVLGQLDLDRAVEESRVEPSTALAHEAARVLFPSLPYWRPLLDDLMA
jgi:predicted acetyltransferase